LGNQFFLDDPGLTDYYRFCEKDFQLPAGFIFFVCKVGSAIKQRTIFVDPQMGRRLSVLAPD
jgi:hypothetical protein